MQYNEYYPFGHAAQTSWTRENVTGNNFLANGGTEVNTTTQLYDLDFRNLDPILGRMHQVDPMAAKYASLTPYNVSFNDPVGFTDPTGADPLYTELQMLMYGAEIRGGRVVVRQSIRGTIRDYGTYGGGSAFFDYEWRPGAGGLRAGFHRYLDDRIFVGQACRELAESYYSRSAGSIQSSPNTTLGDLGSDGFWEDPPDDDEPSWFVRLIAQYVMAFERYGALVNERDGEETNDFNRNLQAGFDDVNEKILIFQSGWQFQKLATTPSRYSNGIAKASSSVKTTSSILSWGRNANGHLIKHANALGFVGYTPQQLQKMLPRLRSAANQLLNNANPALTRIGRWHDHENAIMYIGNGKMLVTTQSGEFITIINKTSNNWYQFATPLR